MTDLLTLPDNLPVPKDDGACKHLLNQRLPDIWFNATTGKTINLADIKGWLVVFCYPMTGEPGVPLPTDWDTIPGARGCTPQHCAFRDIFHAFSSLNVQLFGLSSQSTDKQLEVVDRLQLPYALLSDQTLNLTHTLNLPTFTVDGMTFNQRVTLIAHNGIIQHYYYPVFPPTHNAAEVLDWLMRHV